MKPGFLLVQGIVCFLQFPSQGQNRTTPEDVKQTMDRVLAYVDQSTPVGIVNAKTGEKIVDLKNPKKEATLAKTTYNITSHQWGLTYAGMLLAGETTGDGRFREYVSRHFEFLSKGSVIFVRMETHFLVSRTP